jgi:hypothetical protein
VGESGQTIYCGLTTSSSAASAFAVGSSDFDKILENDMLHVVLDWQKYIRLFWKRHFSLFCGISAFDGRKIVWMG